MPFGDEPLRVHLGAHVLVATLAGHPTMQAAANLLRPEHQEDVFCLPRSPTPRPGRSNGSTPGTAPKPTSKTR
jgi:hypothetical protein